MLRNLIGIDPGNRLIVIGDLVKKGQRLRFFRRDHDTARADMGRMLDSIKEGLYTTPRGALYYSCLGRGGALLGGESEELRMIQSALGDVPLAGFFGNGCVCCSRFFCPDRTGINGAGLEAGKGGGSGGLIRAGRQQ